MLLRPARLWIATLLASACTHDATLRPDSGGEQASVDAGMRESGVDAPSDARVPQDMDAGEVARDASAMDAGDASIEVGDARVEVGDARVGDASADPDGGGMGPRAVRLRFRAVVGALPFACGQTYGGLGTDAVSMESSDFRFYVQSVRLINARGEEVPVALETRAPFQTALAGGVALLDFEDGSAACGNGNAGTPEQNLELTGTVPDDDYRGIAFVNGVPESLNYLDPATLPDPERVYRFEPRAGRIL